MKQVERDSLQKSVFLTIGSGYWFIVIGYLQGTLGQKKMSQKTRVFQNVKAFSADGTLAA